ncbi:MAG: DUF1289 domain-containing protein [Arenicellales bacterium]
MKHNKSPCIDVCDFGGPKGWCRGCGRTKAECQKWKALKPYAKTTLLKELEKRKNKMSSVS